VMVEIIQSHYKLFYTSIRPHEQAYPCLLFLFTCDVPRNAH
jgi:hypothetical protein